MPHRVVVTGVGIVSPVGTGKEAFWKAITSGESGIRRIAKFDPAMYSSQVAGEVSGFDPSVFFDAKEARHLDPFCQYAIAAAEMAFEDANLKVGVYDPVQAGAVVGSGTGGLTTMENALRTLIAEGPRRISPFTVPMMIENLAAGNISIKFNLKGPNMCIITACATGTHSIGEAFRIIKRGEAKMMVAGGAEAPITPLGLGSFCAVKALTSRNDMPEKASRPFEKDRDGFVIAEGCGILILENLKDALRRNAPIYAEISGYGLTADAFHITAPDETGDGAARAMQGALDEAGMRPEEVDYINAHGTSTLYNDRIETLAIKTVFKDHAYKVKVSSTKSMTGHLLGAAGGLEGVVSTLVVKDGIIPPTINYDNKDPDCDLDYVPNKSVKQDVRAVMSNSFGFGGQNAVLVFKKPEM